MGRKREHPIKQNKLFDYKLRGALVLTVCTAIGALLFSGITTARYRSEVEGTGVVEPALFNTVLLGDLPFSVDVTMINDDNTSSVKTVDEVMITDKDGKVVANKLAASLNVTEQIQFGAVNLNNEAHKLRPGSLVAIPFTVTNGTTRYADGEGNLAETDIIYKMTLTTTVNIPLQYDVYEYTNEEQLKYIKDFVKDDARNYTQYKDETTDRIPDPAYWGMKLPHAEEDIIYDEAVGRSKTYTIFPQGINPETEATEAYFKLDREPLKVDGKEEEAIDINRYVLLISWPDTTDAQKSTKYMKEIDIIEVRLEIESWTEDYEPVSMEKVETDREGTVGLFRIQPDLVGHETYYQLPIEGSIQSTFPNVQNVYCRGTIPFYALRQLSEEENQHTYYWDFKVTNLCSYQMNWKDTEGEGKYEAETQKTSLTGGRVAIAVPVQEVMGTINDYCSDNFTYQLVHNGITYNGKVIPSSAEPETGMTETYKYITTEIWEKRPETVEPEAGDELYGTSKQNAYRIIEFEGLVLPNFTEAEVREEKLRLLVTSNNQDAAYEQKEDFKVLIYKTEVPETPEGGEQTP